MALLWLTSLVNGLLAGTAVTLLAWVVSCAGRRWSAATRYGMWWVALVLTAILPALFYARAGAPPSPAPAVTETVGTPAASEMPTRLEAERVSDAIIPAPNHAGRETATASRWRLPLSIGISQQFPAWLTLAWGFAVLFGAARLVREGILLHRFRRRCLPPSAQLQARMDRHILRTGTQRMARLVLSCEIRGPLAFGFLRPVVALPAALADQLSIPELDNILLHELAHLRRRDDWARLVQRIIETLFFFHPAIVWLGRKLDLEREIACDDWVIAVTGQPREYASCLTRVVELAGFRRGWALATGAAEKKSHLIRRIELMLDKTRNRAPQASKLALVVVAVVAILAAAGAGKLPPVFAFSTDSYQDVPPVPPVPNAPHAPARAQHAFPVPPAPPAPHAPHFAAYAPAPPSPEPPAGLAPPAPLAPAPPPPDENRSWRSTWRENGRSLDLRVEGTIEFSDDDRDVKRLSPNGRFSMEASGNGETKRFEVRSDSNGTLTRSYTVDGRQRSLDEARPWLAGTLPEVIRETAIGAGERIQRIAQRGGTGAAMREIGLIRSDHSKRVYINEMVSRVRLNDQELGETMRLVRRIGSDGEKTQTIVSIGPKYLRAGLREPLFEAVDSLNSDGEHRRALNSIIQADPSKETVTLASRSAARISSDGEKAAVLIQIARTNIGGDDAARAWMKAAATINSDGEKRRALAAMAVADRRPATVAAILRVAATINSDGEKANLLIEAAPGYADTDLVRKPFFDAASSIHSDGEHARVLLAVLDRNPSPATISEVARSARTISSDGEKSRVLLRIARENLTDANIRTGFFEALDSVSSDGDHARTLLVLAGRSSLPDDLVIASVRSAAKIHSDGEKARVLLIVAQNYGSSRAVNQEVRAAAKSISSDGEYRRVMRAVERDIPVI